jgi:hypothetical protein
MCQGVRVNFKGSRLYCPGKISSCISRPYQLAVPVGDRPAWWLWCRLCVACDHPLTEAGGV